MSCRIMQMVEPLSKVDTKDLVHSATAQTDTNWALGSAVNYYYNAALLK